MLHANRHKHSNDIPSTNLFVRDGYTSRALSSILARIIHIGTDIFWSLVRLAYTGNVGLSLQIAHSAGFI